MLRKLNMNRFLPLLAIAVSASTVSAAEVVTVAGNSSDGYTGDNSVATSAAVSQPFGIVVGPDKALYICEVGSHVIRRVDAASRKITTVVGNGIKGFRGNGRVATEANLNEPYEVRFDKNGHMFFVEMQNHAVRRVDAKTGIISLVAGCGEKGFSGDGGPATDARMSRPHSIALDNDNNMYICDIGNHRIRRVDLNTGMISTFSGTGQKKPTPDGAAISETPLNGPRALDFDGQNSLILALREGNAIYRLNLKTQTVHHLGGTGKSGYTGDGGPAKQATLSGPKGVALGPGGDIFFADTESHTVRVIRANSGIIETVIGNGSKGDGPDGNPKHCKMDRPHGVFVDTAGRVYVGDSNNHRVRMLVP